MDNVIENIDRYLSDTQEFINDFKYELKKKEFKESMFYDVYSIVMYYKENINYNIDEYEIHCRALRDKLNESEILSNPICNEDIEATDFIQVNDSGIKDYIIHSIIKELLSNKSVEDCKVTEFLREYIRNDAKNSPSLQALIKALNFLNLMRKNRIDEQIQSISLLNDGGFCIRVKQFKQVGWLDIEIRNDFEKFILDRKANGARFKSYNLTLEEVLLSVQSHINLDKESLQFSLQE